MPQHKNARPCPSCAATSGYTGSDQPLAVERRRLKKIGITYHQRSANGDHGGAAGKIGA